MGKQEDKRLAALVKRNMAKIAPPKQEKAATYDDTLRLRPEDQDADTKQLFKDMKKREF